MCARIPYYKKFARRALLLLVFFAVQSIITAGIIHAASLHLAWNVNPEDDLSGYNVYYTSSDTYGDPLNVGKVTEYELSGLDEGVTYYIAITAYDTSNNESAKSDPVSAVARSISTTTTSATTTKPIHDNTPPSGTIIINNNLEVTDSLNVILTLTGIDDGIPLDENALMSFSNDNQNWSNPVPYANTKMWTLSPGEGEKTIYVKFCDAAGNWMTTPAQDQIIYEKSENACHEPQKLLTSATTVSSQFLPFFSKNNAIDGNPLTIWSTLFSFFKKDEFITLDLGEIKKISWLTMQAASTLFGTDFFPTNFQIQTSSDNITWQEISMETGFSPPLQFSSPSNWDLNNRECRYIRVYITKAKTIFFFFKVAQIAEIGVYGCDSAGSKSLITSEDLALFNLKDHDQVPRAIPGKLKTSRTGASENIAVVNGHQTFQEGSTVCDDGDMCTSFTGTWDLSDKPDVYGNTSLISREGGNYTWTPDLLKEGYYQLYMWWNSGMANCSSCPVEISCDGVLLDTLYVDQQQDGGQWNPLGTFNLESGNACSVTLISESARLKACADAVKCVYMGESLPESGINFIYPNPATVAEEVCFEGYASPSEGEIIEDYSWVSDLDGEISTHNSFCTSSLSEGTHRITFTVRNDSDIWSAPAEKMVSIINSTPFPQEIWLEAEEGIINSPMEADWDNDASTGEYIWIPNTVGNALDSTQDSGYAEYSFEVLEAGDFVVWGRVISNSSQDDSFFFSMDGGAYALWDTLKGGKENWVWDQVSDRRIADPVIFHLGIGIHTLVIKQREDGAKLDRIVITNDRAYDPSGRGE